MTLPTRSQSCLRGGLSRSHSTRCLGPGTIQFEVLSEKLNEADQALQTLSTSNELAIAGFGILSGVVDSVVGSVFNAQGGFKDLASIGKAAGEALKSAFKGVVAELVSVIAKALILKAILAAVSGGGSASFGEVLKGVVTGNIGDLFPGRASGGPVNAGTAYLVGERGPELFVPNRSGSIMPNGVGGSVKVEAVPTLLPNGLLLDWQEQAGSQARRNFGA